MRAAWCSGGARGAVPRPEREHGACLAPAATRGVGSTGHEPSQQSIALPLPSCAAGLLPDIRIDLYRGAIIVSVSWLGQAASECGGMVARLVAVILIDTMWLCSELLGGRPGTDHSRRSVTGRSLVLANGRSGACQLASWPGLVSAHAAPPAARLPG